MGRLDAKGEQRGAAHGHSSEERRAVPRRAGGRGVRAEHRHALHCHRRAEARWHDGARPTAPLLWQVVPGRSSATSSSGRPRGTRRTPPTSSTCGTSRCSRTSRSTTTHSWCPSGTAWRTRPGLRRAPRLGRPRRAIAAAKDPAHEEEGRGSVRRRARKYLLEKRAAYSACRRPSTACRRHVQSHHGQDRRDRATTCRTQADRSWRPRAARASGERLRETFRSSHSRSGRARAIEHFGADAGSRASTPPPPFARAAEKLLDIVD